MFILWITHKSYSNMCIFEIFAGYYDKRNGNFLSKKKMHMQLRIATFSLVAKGFHVGNVLFGKKKTDLKSNIETKMQDAIFCIG